MWLGATRLASTALTHVLFGWLAHSALCLHHAPKALLLSK